MESVTAALPDAAWRLPWCALGVHGILIPAQMMFEVFVTIGVCVWTSAMVAESSNRAWAWVIGVGLVAFGIAPV